MRAEHEFSMRELQDSGRRLREDCAHQVELERSKVRQLEDQLARQRQQVNAANTTCEVDLCPSKSVSWEGSVDPGVMRSRPQLMSILSNPPILKWRVKRFTSDPVCWVVVDLELYILSINKEVHIKWLTFLFLLCFTRKIVPNKSCFASLSNTQRMNESFEWVIQWLTHASWMNQPILIQKDSDQRMYFFFFLQSLIWKCLGYWSKASNIMLVMWLNVAATIRAVSTTTKYTRSRGCLVLNTFVKSTVLGVNDFSSLKRQWVLN